MSFDAHTNLAYGHVLTAPDPAASGTTLVVESGQGALFPAVPFNATVWPSGVQPLTSNAEIVRVTDISTDTFTIVRAQEGTSARSIEVSDQIAATITAKTLTDVETAIPASTADLPDSSDARYVTDAELTVLGNTSGTNTGDQTISLTSDVTGSGTGSFAATIAAGAVTTAKLASAVTLDAIATAHSTANDVAMNTYGLTGLTAASSVTDLTFSSATGAVSGDLIFKTNSVERGRFKFDGTIQFGTALSLDTKSPQTLVYVGKNWSAPGGTTQQVLAQVESAVKGTSPAGPVSYLRGYSSWLADAATVVDKTTTAMSRSGTTVTVTAAGHGFANGDAVAIYGVTHTFNAEINGWFAVAGVTTNTFQVTLTGLSSGSYTSGGTVTNRPSYYGGLFAVVPTVARGGLTGTAAHGDDVNGLGVINRGTALATSGLLVNHNAVNFGGGAFEYQDAIQIEANAQYGLNMIGTYDYGIDFNGSGLAVYNQAPMRLGNAQFIAGMTPDGTTGNLIGVTSDTGGNRTNAIYLGGTGIGHIIIPNDRAYMGLSADGSTGYTIGKIGTLNTVHIGDPAAALELYGTGSITATSQKITNLANGTAATDAATYGQIPVELNYTEITSPVNVTSTTEASGTTIISPGAITFDGAPVLVHFKGIIRVPTATATANAVHVSLFEGSTEICRIATMVLGDLASAQQLDTTVSGFYRFTPTAGSHTYTVTAFATSTTGTPLINAGAGGTAAPPPAFVRFTKV